MEQLRTCIIFGMIAHFANVDADCVQKHAAADMVFLVDSSGSVSRKEFQIQKEFVVNFAKSFTIGPNNVQIGMVTFSTNVHNEFNLSTHHRKSALINAINALNKTGGHTFTGKGLQYVEQHSFTTAAGERPNVGNILILMTDGESDDHTVANEEAAKLRNRNVTVIAIGIGLSSFARYWLERYIVSDAEHLFTIFNFGDLTGSLQAKLKNVTCVAEDGPTTPVSSTTPAAEYCSVYGDPHVNTTDNFKYTVQGDVPCNYYLVRHQEDPVFNIIGRLIKCNLNRPHRRISCLDSIQIDFKGNTWILAQGGDVTDQFGNSLTAPVNLSDIIVIKDSGNKIVAELFNGVEVKWDKRKHADILVPISYKGTITGLCGNYDGNANDDHDVKENINQYKVDSSCPYTN